MCAENPHGSLSNLYFCRKIHLHYFKINYIFSYKFCYENI